LVGVTVLELEVAGWPWDCPGFSTPFDSSSSSDERLANLADKSSDARFILTTGETGGPEVKARRGDSHDHAAGSTPLASRARARVHCGHCERGRPEELVPFCRMFFACASSRDGRSVNFFSISCKGSAESRKRKAVRRGL
jgi:hypothetical protein